jgi:1,2-diacylglycerol 3-alpha-glucosyltransferase
MVPRRHFLVTHFEYVARFARKRLFQRMRILMISDVYFPRVNGVSTSIRTFRRELMTLGHHVTLIAPNYEIASDDDADIVRVPSRGVPRDPEDRMMRRKSIDRLPRLSKDRFDIVHIQTPFVAHYAGIYLAKQLRVPTIESYHTFFEEYLHHYVPFVPRNVMRFIARRVTVSQCNAVDRIISPSRAMHAALTDYGVKSRIDILPTGLEQSQFRLGDGARFRAKHGITADRPTLLYVGRVAHEKNIEFLLRMMTAVREKIPSALFLIVGEGPAREHLRAQAIELGLSDSVKFIGYLDRDTELLDCYRGGDVFVFASRTETQGLVLLEALAQGTPVVSTMHMGTRDVLENARGVRIVGEQISEFAEAVIKLLRNKIERERLATVAPNDAMKWSSREMAERLVRSYATTIQTHQRVGEPMMTT